MTPEQKVIAKERGAKAMKEMKDCGFPGKKTMTVIKRLLKSLDFDWELIEAENYSILVDAIISFDESEEQRPLKRRTDGDNEDEDGNGQIVNDEVPLCRKRPASNQVEQPLCRDFIVKKPKLEVDHAPENGFEQQRHNEYAENSRVSSDIASLDTSSRLGKSDPVSSLTNAKGKGILVDGSPGQSGAISPRATRRDRSPVIGILMDKSHGKLVQIPPRAYGRDKSLVERSQPLVTFKEPKPEPGIETFPESFAVTAPESHPPALEVPFHSAPFPRNTGEKEGCQGSYPKKCSVGDGCLSQEATVQYRDKERNAKGVECSSSSSAKAELASSANGMVKLLLSLKEADADYQMPNLDSVLDLVEERCLKSAKFPIKDILKEMCEMVLELSKSSNSGIGS